MSKKSKILFIFPPVSSPVSPYLSVPLLAGQLKASGYDVKCLDLSLEFFDYVLNRDFLLAAYNKAKKFLQTIDTDILSKSSKDNDFSESSFELKNLVLKKEHIEKIVLNDEENLSIINNIAEYIETYKNKTSFYNLEKMNFAYKEIAKAFQLAMLPYFPATLFFHAYKNPIFLTTYSGLKYQAEDRENNIFYEFYEKKIAEYKINEYDLVYISCPNETQILPSMTFAKILKEKSDTKIAIGGNIISRVVDELQKMPKLFEEFFDYILCGLGEDSVVKLADYLINKKGNLKSIKGLLYQSKNKVVMNKPDFKYNINKSADMSLDGFSLNRYYTPDIIMPIQSSKGCYWGKCTFCGLHCPPKKYTVKNAKQMVDEIEFLHKEHGIKYFEFIDEAIHPKYLARLADEIIKRNLDIKYVCCARMEPKYYTKELCEKMFKSGLRLVQFGYESAVKRVYDTLNKGIKFEGRLDCIKECAKAGIFTYLYAIVGYPNEAKEEALQTISIIDKHPDIIDFLFIHEFWLDKKSPAYKNYKKIGISEIINNKTNILAQKSDFVVNHDEYENNLNSVYKTYFQKTQLYKNNFFSPDEYIFLYILHYGREKSKELLCTCESNTN